MFFVCQLMYQILLLLDSWYFSFFEMSSNDSMVKLKAKLSYLLRFLPCDIADPVLGNILYIDDGWQKILKWIEVKYYAILYENGSLYVILILRYYTATPIVCRRSTRSSILTLPRQRKRLPLLIRIHFLRDVFRCEIRSKTNKRKQDCDFINSPEWIRQNINSGERRQRN